MRLLINRNQQQVKGFLGGNKGMLFELKCRVELTSPENDLVARYKVRDMDVAGAIVPDGKDPSLLTVGKLLEGITYPCRDVTQLLAVEEQIKNGCKNFKMLLMVMNTFGGEEVVEF